MTRTIAALVLAAIVACDGAASAKEILWRDNDDLPVAEPEEDREADYLWWDGVWAMTYYQLWKVFDLGHSLPAAGELVGLAKPHEAANANALDEVPDSTWFTNRHARERLSAESLARGPQADKAPAEDGPLTVLSGKSTGMTLGFVMKDAKGDRYIVKFDPPKYPDVPTGAEMVCSKIVWALGWNVPEYYLLLLDPARLEIDSEATIKDRYGRKAPFTREILDDLLTRVGKRPDGRYRVMASRFIDGTPKGGFRTLGRRRDDANDTIPHQDRRDLRGLRVVAAWLNFTDARRGNFYDAWVTTDEESKRGHLVHYVLDFSSALGSGNDDWKETWIGQEYFFTIPKALRSLTFGLVRPAWADPPLAHPAIGYLNVEHFDPRSWRTTYPNPLFDHATVRDQFWGAKLVASITEEDLDVVTRMGEWTDPSAADVLARILRGRQQKLYETYFDPRRINPVDGFDARRDRLEFRDLAVEHGVVARENARYRARRPGGPWQETDSPAVPIPTLGTEIELETSADRGASWSPTTRVSLERGRDGSFAVVGIDRETR